MDWRGPLASAVLGISLVAVGCEGDGMFMCPTDLSLLSEIKAAGLGETLEARAQAPDPEKPVVVTTLQKPTTEKTVGVTAARVRAIVNGEAILDEELRAIAFPVLRGLEGLPEPERSKRQTEVLSLSLNTLIEREVVLQDAMVLLKKPGNEKNYDKFKEMTEKEFDKGWLRPVKEQLKLKTDDDLKVFLKGQGTSFEMQKRLWTRNYMKEQYLQQRVFPTVDIKLGHPQIVDYYEKHPEQFKIEDEVQWQELFIAMAKYTSREAPKRWAEQLAQRMRQGEDFAKLSEQYDDGDSRYRKGEGIGRKHGEIKPPEVEATLFSLKEGDIAILEQPSGFRIVRVLKRQVAGLKPFDEKTQKLIKDKIRGEIMERETKRMVVELKRDAVIEVLK